MWGYKEMCCIELGRVREMGMGPRQLEREQSSSQGWSLAANECRKKPGIVAAAEENEDRSDGLSPLGL